MDFSWPYWVSGLCGILLTALTLALIFNHSFRKDISASEGKANLFNVISIEGAFILVLCGLLFSGLIYPVAFPKDTFEQRLKQYSLPTTDINSFIQQHLQLTEQFKQLQSKLSTDFIEHSQIVSYIKDLSPESETAKSLYALPAKKMGPWSPFPSAKVITVSIPSHHIEPGHALSCQEYYGQTFELVGQPDINIEPVNVLVDGFIFKSADCHKLISYDLQISCPDAQTLFGKHALNCDEQGEAKWLNKPKSLSVYLTPKMPVQTAQTDS